MVDCFDRIAVRMTEIILEPVRLLRESAQLAAVTLRTPSAGRRFAITIEKRFPDGTNEAPSYRWSLLEIAPDGDPLPDGMTASSSPEERYAQPEDAYWAAANALCAETKPDARPSWLLESAHQMVG